MWSCPGNMPKYYPGLRHITRPKARPGQDHYTECLIVQVICQNITVPNITTETFTMYNNTCYHIFYCNMLIFACPIIANSQCWLFALTSVFAPVFNFRYLRSGLKDYMSKYKER